MVNISNRNITMKNDKTKKVRRRVDGSPMTPQPNKEKWTPGTMHIHDLNATILHLLGIDHRKLTYRFQGRDFRLTDIHGHVMTDLIA